jgi:hypothetical protein
VSIDPNFWIYLDGQVIQIESTAEQRRKDIESEIADVAILLTYLVMLDVSLEDLSKKH